MPRRRVSGGDDRVRADVADAEVVCTIGEPAVATLEVTNLDAVICSYQVRVLGLDATYVQVDSPALDLFPGERREVTITFDLPETFPAGRRRIAVEVAESDVAADTAVMVGFDLVLASREALTMTVEPTSQTVGKSGSFVLDIHNSGNTTLDLSLTAEEPERKVETTFDPPVNRVLPGEQVLVTASTVGERPWFGMPVIRPLEFAVTSGQARGIAPAMLIQRPRISRKVLSILGLFLVATLFAFVILASFNSVAERADANEQLIKQGLGEDQPVGPRATPSRVGGVISSTTGGPIDGATVELYHADDPVLPAHATVTNASGGYGFGNLPEGSYLLRVEVAGFTEVWYPDAATFEDAQEFELAPGTDIADIDVALEGRPGSVTGTVVGTDVEGAVVAAEIPGESIEGSELEPAPAMVATMEVDATGEFSLADLATPATYELLVTKPGFASERRTVSLAPGEQREDLQVLLGSGDGRIAGTVTDTGGTPLPNVQIDATDGTSDSATRTLSGDDDAGTFELRGLATPATYTLSVVADGYFPESVTLSLDEQQQVDDLAIVMTSDRGTLGGLVTAPDGSPLGGVDIIIDGADEEFATVSLSEGEVGRWLASGLPVPGEYTVTFSRPGRATQALSVELLSGAQADRTNVDVVLPRSSASIRGLVVDPDGDPISGVDITLDSSSTERATRSSDQPPGAYGFADLPPGAYSITYDRVGSRAQTLLVDLGAGDELELDPVELEPQSGIVGIVRRDGVPEAGVGVVVYAAGTYPDEAVAETVTTTGGAFEIIGLNAPESYIVEFQVPAGGEVIGSRTLFLHSGETSELEVDW